jgi:hypothetical protein
VKVAEFGERKAVVSNPAGRFNMYLKRMEESNLEENSKIEYSADKL